MDRTPPSSGQPGPAPDAVTADWPKKAVDAIDRVVGVVHDKAVRPVALVARAVVFGLLVAALGTVLLVLLSIALLRLLDSYAFEGRVWLSYLVLGAVFSAGGLLLWTKRLARGDGEVERI